MEKKSIPTGNASTSRAGPEPVRIWPSVLQVAGASCSKLWLPLFQFSKAPYESKTGGAFGSRTNFSQITTSRSGFRKGSGCSRTALTTLNIAVVAPIPSASVRITTVVNPGVRAKVRAAYATSCLNRSSQAQPHASRASSLSKPALPKERWAAYCASSGGSPLPARSSASSSRSDRSSRSRSSSRCLCHHITSTLLGRPHDLRNCCRHLRPLRLRLQEAFSPGGRQPVVLELPVAIGRGLPLRGNPALSLQTMERRIKRTVLHLKEIVGRSLNVLSD